MNTHSSSSSFQAALLTEELVAITWSGPATSVFVRGSFLTDQQDSLQLISDSHQFTGFVKMSPTDTHTLEFIVDGQRCLNPDLPQTYLDGQMWNLLSLPTPLDALFLEDEEEDKENLQTATPPSHKPGADFSNTDFTRRTAPRVFEPQAMSPFRGTPELFSARANLNSVDYSYSPRSLQTKLIDHSALGDSILIGDEIIVLAQEQETVGSSRALDFEVLRNKPSLDGFLRLVIGELSILGKNQFIRTWSPASSSHAFSKIVSRLLKLTASPPCFAQEVELAVQILEDLGSAVFCSFFYDQRARIVAMRAKVLHVSGHSSFLSHFMRDSLFRAQVCDLLQLDQVAEVGLYALNDLIDSHPEVRHSVPLSRLSKQNALALTRTQSSSKDCLRREVMTRLTALIVNKLNLQLMRHVAGGRSFRGIGLLLCQDTRFSNYTGSYDDLCFSYILDSLDAESVGIRGPLSQYEDKKRGAFGRDYQETIELEHRGRLRKYTLTGEDQDPKIQLRSIWK